MASKNQALSLKIHRYFSLSLISLSPFPLSLFLSPTACFNNSTMNQQRFVLRGLALVVSAALLIFSKKSATFSLQNNGPTSAVNKLQSSPPTNNATTPSHKQSTKSSVSSCPSLYKLGTGSEHSPLVFQQDNLLVCRTPKVASTLLRNSIAKPYYLHHHNDTSLFNLATHLQQMTLAKVRDKQQFIDYLYSNKTRRIMFVRHPVTRILSGFMESASVEGFWTELYNFTESYNGSPKSFELWLTNSSFFREYDVDCDPKNSFEQSNHPMRQHWQPPQHCRCGISDCRVEWTIYRIEDEPVGQIMARYLPILSGAINETSSEHVKQYNASMYFNERVLSILNKLTMKEQRFFGYEPYKVS
jgi:hypothetical protein